jgi:hypothetical protein
VQQLAARLRTKELIAFFEKVGPVKEAQIVKDRVSGRSKGLVFLPFSRSPSKSVVVLTVVDLVSATSNSKMRNRFHLPFSLPAKSF